MKQQLITFVNKTQSPHLDETWYLFGPERAGKYCSPYSKKKGSQPLIPHPPMTPEARRSLVHLKRRVKHDYDFDGYEEIIMNSRSTGSSKKAAFWGDVQDQLEDIFRLGTWAGLKRPLKLPRQFEQVQRIVDFYTGYYCMDSVIRTSYKEIDELFPNMELPDQLTLEQAVTSAVKAMRSWVDQERRRPGRLERN